MIIKDQCKGYIIQFFQINLSLDINDPIELINASHKK